ncbi:exonuclease domain-containing protein [Streptomyces sp. NPDC059092]|uniref:exonuclease domain-containing protein n=1 Tax=Streptomyces sp. NPDC059092 TaxID=3346725 RepID=UPI0036783C82
MTCWYEGPLAAFDTGTTGADAEKDRIVSAALIIQDTTGIRPRVRRWLIDPGVPLPPGATEAHGLTENFLHRNGRWPAPVVEEVARALAEQCKAGRPLVVMNAPFGLTLLDRELRRHRASSLGRRMENAPLCVLDPLVLDRHLDRYRKGSRDLNQLCAEYEVGADGVPDAADDDLSEVTEPVRPAWPAWPSAPAGPSAPVTPAVVAAVSALSALELVRAIGRRFAGRMERLSPQELHTLQAVWHAAQSRGPQAWFSRGSGEGATDPAWPLRPELPAAAV